MEGDLYTVFIKVVLFSLQVKQSYIFDIGQFFASIFFV